MGTFPSAPDFSGRTPIQFICSANPPLSINSTNGNLLYNNPDMFYIKPGTVAKLDMGINGTSYISGDGEYSPFALEMTWKVLGWTDYQALAALRSYPVTLISYRNNGFYGKLYLDGPKGVAGPVSDIVSTKATFLCLTPSDEGGANTVNRISTSGATFAVVNSNTTNTGWILASAQNYYWLTFSSIWGETAPVASGLISNTHANTSNAISWVWPTSTTYCTKASIYVSNLNDPTQTRLVAEVINGETPTWTDLVGFGGMVVNRIPPTVSTAYRGMWQSGVWNNEA